MSYIKTSIILNHWCFCTHESNTWKYWRSQHNQSNKAKKEKEFISQEALPYMKNIELHTQHFHKQKQEEEVQENAEGEELLDKSMK